MRGKGRRGEFAARPRQTHYPMWGIDDPYRGTNAHELYRYGERGLLNRYIVPPSDVIDKRRAIDGKPLLGNAAYELLKPGVAVEDIIIGLLVAGFMYLLSIPVGAGIDGYLESMGW